MIDLADYPDPNIAEVVSKGGEVRLRIAFKQREGVYADGDFASLGLQSGTFVELEDGALRRSKSGAPVVFAAAGTALAEVCAIAMRAEISIGFSQELRNDAKMIADNPRTDDPALEDLRHLPFVTIDYEHSRDLDQAVFVSQDDPASGSFVVFYALADAAAYVEPSSKLFAEALSRGTSYYLPGLTVPMLPRVLSEGVVSLGANVDRRAFVFRIHIDGRGEVTGHSIHRGVIRSRAKLTYDGVDELVANPSTSPLAGCEAHDSLKHLAAVGELRIAEAERRGVISYNRISADLSIESADAESLSIRSETRNAAQRWNEQISLVTNTVGAEYLASEADPKSAIAGLFRGHPAPQKKELNSFEEAVGELVATLGLDDAWRFRGDEETLAQYIARLPDAGKRIRLAAALQRQAMIMGEPSRFSTEVAPHFGVGADQYSRFSSPMREIVGIATMHIAISQERDVALADAGLDAEIIDKIAAAGNRAGKVQKTLTRACNKLALDQLLSAELKLDPAERPVRAASVLGVSERKIYLKLDEPPLEVKLYVPDQESFVGTPLKLVNRFELASPNLDLRIRVGDLAEVRVERYSSDRERWVLALQTDAGSG